MGKLDGVNLAESDWLAQPEPLKRKHFVINMDKRSQRFVTALHDLMYIQSANHTSGLAASGCRVTEILHPSSHKIV